MPYSTDGLLTTRQKVAALLDEGLSVREISKRLDITTQSVYLHIKNLEKGVPPRHAVHKSDTA
jgi:DNA-binding NarL/FixJ family response regulator